MSDQLTPDEQLRVARMLWPKAEGYRIHHDESCVWIRDKWSGRWESRTLDSDEAVGRMMNYLRDWHHARTPSPDRSHEYRQMMAYIASARSISRSMSGKSIKPRASFSSLNRSAVRAATETMRSMYWATSL